MKLTKSFLSLVLIASAFSACKQLDFKKTKEGFPYKIFSDGKGEKIVAGDFVGLHRTIKIKDSIIQTSYGAPPQIVPIPKDSSIKANELAEILLGARKGDSIQLNQSIDSILRKNPQSAQDPLIANNKGKDIVYIFKVTEVYKKQEEAVAAMEKQNMEAFNQQPDVVAQRKKDEAAIEAYLKKNNIQAQRTPWGTYVQILTPGSGPKPKPGQFAMLKYTGKDLNGNVFDASERHGGQLLPLQIGAGRSIIGFEDGVKQLSEGAKAVIYIPSVLGYGAQGNPPDIQPNQNLLFEIDVVDITDRQPAPSRPQMPDSTGK
jgi:FKBP-type peptidyl-prolyl cis-trans isomerase FkpA